MIYQFHHVCDVESGVLGVADFASNMLQDSSVYQHGQRAIAPGIYDVKLTCNDCWSPFTITSVVAIPSGVIFFGDPAPAFISENWSKMCDRMFHFPNGCLTYQDETNVWVNCGGDGAFDLSITLELRVPIDHLENKIWINRGLAKFQ